MKKNIQKYLDFILDNRYKFEVLHIIRGSLCFLLFILLFVAYLFAMAELHAESSDDDTDGESSNDSELDEEEHTIPEDSVMHQNTFWYTNGQTETMISRIQEISEQRDTNQLLSLIDSFQTRIDHINFVDPNRSDPAFDDHRNNLKSLQDKCAQHIEGLTGSSDMTDVSNRHAAASLANPEDLNAGNNAVNVNPASDNSDNTSNSRANNINDNANTNDDINTNNNSNINTNDNDNTSNASESNENETTNNNNSYPDITDDNDDDLYN